MEQVVRLNKTDENENLMMYGYDISFVSFDDNWAPHYHLATEIIYIHEGRILVFMNHKRYELGPDDMLVIDSMTIHAVVVLHPHSKGIVIEISKKYMTKYIPDFELLSLECFSRDYDQDNPEISAMKDSIKDLFKLHTEKNHSYLLRSNGIMMLLLAILEENYSKPTFEVADEKFRERMERLAEIMEFTERNYSKPITLQEAADHLCLNREYFCRYVKKTLGHSYMDYLTHVRLSHIYEELINTSDPVLEIIERNGFANQKLFYSRFRKRFGCTPGELRKMRKL